MLGSISDRGGSDRRSPRHRIRIRASRRSVVSTKRAPFRTSFAACGLERHVRAPHGGFGVDRARDHGGVARRRNVGIPRHRVDVLDRCIRECLYDPLRNGAARAAAYNRREALRGSLCALQRTGGRGNDWNHVRAGRPQVPAPIPRGTVARLVPSCAKRFDQRAVPPSSEMRCTPDRRSPGISAASQPGRSAVA